MKTNNNEPRDLSYGELAELGHAGQVSNYGWCSCEQGDRQYDDCPRDRGTRGGVHTMSTYEYEVQGLYCDGWEIVTTESNKLDAQRTLRDYRTNEWGVAFRIKRVRV